MEKETVIHMTEDHESIASKQAFVIGRLDESKFLEGFLKQSELVPRSLLESVETAVQLENNVVRTILIFISRWNFHEDVFVGR